MVAAWAAGVRGLSRGRRHRGLLEVGLTQLVVETSVTTLAGVRGRRLYGPSAQLGYQYASPSGVTALVTFGAGYTLSAPVTGMSSHSLHCRAIASGIAWA